MSAPVDTARPPRFWRALAVAVDGWLRLPALLRWCVPLGCMALLWLLSSREATGARSGTIGALIHNGMHVVAYAAVSGSMWLAWSRRPAAQPRQLRSLGSVLIATLYGAVDEVHQSFVAGRTASVLDLLSDGVGAALAVVLLVAAVDPQPARAAFGRRAVIVLSVGGCCSAALATFCDW